MADEIWDSWQDTNFYGKTQAVTDEDFDKAIESKKEKKNFFGFFQTIFLYLYVLCFPY